MSEEKSNNSNNNSPLRTIIFLIIFLPVIGWLVMFSIKKNSESGQRSQACQEECSAGGHLGYEFNWNILSGPVCKCLQ